MSLTGNVEDRQTKRLIEDLIEEVSGVREINNQLRIHRGQGGSQGAMGQQGTNLQGAGGRSGQQSAMGQQGNVSSGSGTTSSGGTSNVGGREHEAQQGTMTGGGSASSGTTGQDKSRGKSS